MIQSIHWAGLWLFGQWPNFRYHSRTPYGFDLSQCLQTLSTPNLYCCFYLLYLLFQETIGSGTHDDIRTGVAASGGQNSPHMDIIIAKHIRLKGPS